MSNPGLYASIYQLIQEYAELVDHTLIRLKSGSSQVNDPKRQKLGNFLINLADEKWDSLSTRMLALILQDRGDDRQKKWSKLGRTLLSDQVDASSIQDLEELAVTLEHEQAGAITKMRGGSR